jgi:hypothetical protein
VRPTIDLTTSSMADKVGRPKPKNRRSNNEAKPTNSIENELRFNSLRSLLELAIPPDLATNGQPQQSPSSTFPPQHQSQLSHATAPAAEPAAPPARHVPAVPQPARRRPRNSCDVCNRKKTKVCFTFNKFPFHALLTAFPV